MKLASFFSGGKDSTFAIQYALNQGWEIVCLLTIVAKRDSSHWHFINNEWIDLQAKAMEIPLVKVHEYVEIESYRNTLIELKEIYGIDGLLSGVIYSDYQRDYLTKMCNKISLKLFTPLWMKNPLKLMEKIISCGIRSIIVLVAAQGLSENWLGTEIDYEVLNELVKLNKKYKISICGEGGEYETFVYDAPFFKKKIKIGDTSIEWMRDHGLLKIKSARLLAK